MGDVNGIGQEICPVDRSVIKDVEPSGSTANKDSVR
jgi:hypothetical protein